MFQSVTDYIKHELGMLKSYHRFRRCYNDILYILASYINILMLKVEEFYTAMRCYDDILNDSANHIRLKMQPGDMVTTKNLVIFFGNYLFNKPILIF